MKCPKCNIELVNGCCLRCGYLDNGNTIKNSTEDNFKDLKTFNKDFYDLNQNRKTLLIYILGPMYFSYRGFLFTGIIFTLIDSFIMYNLQDYVFWGLFGAFLYFTILRMFFIMFANEICLSIDKIKIFFIKKIYRNNYFLHLEKYKHRKFYLVINILLFIFVIYMLIYKRRVLNGLL